MLLLIEVSDATVAFDKNVKLPLYARAGIPEVWIVNLPDRLIEAYSANRLGSGIHASIAGR